MKITDSKSGNSFFRKTRVRIEDLSNARELTFSCYRGFKFLSSDLTRQWFVEQLDWARTEFSLDLWSYVIMPEHAHVLVYPRGNLANVGVAMGKVKEKVARLAFEYIEVNAPDWLERITVKEGKRVRRRFWQPGSGYDRNVVEQSTLAKMINYIHLNPVRRKLVVRPEDWQWSSARWYAGILPVVLEMDKTIPATIVVT